MYKSNKSQKPILNKTDQKDIYIEQYSLYKVLKPAQNSTLCCLGVYTNEVKM